MLFDVMDIIHQFVETSNWNSKEVFEFIVENRRSIPLPLFKQFCLNYRTYFHPKKKDRIFRDYVKYVLSKSERHNSDIAISYNIVKYVGVDEERERVIIDFLAEQLIQIDIKSHVIKKSIVLSIVEKTVLKKKPL
jgi:hypothetical protein